MHTSSIINPIMIEHKSELLISNLFVFYSFFQSRSQTAVHLVSSRQTGTATNILRALLAAAGKDIRLKADGVSATPECLSVYVCVWMQPQVWQAALAEL